jgi:ABC-type transporter Mla MlaB component
MLHVRAVDRGFTMTGALDHDGGRILLRALEMTDGDIRIDASRVQKVDGAGLTALAIARNRCHADGRAFVLTAIAAEAVAGLRVGGRLPALFAAQPSAETAGEESVPADATADGRAAAPPLPPVTRRRRFWIQRHRH